MRSKGHRMWLVRTRTGEILGPFSEPDLHGEFVRRTFDSQDEIAPPNSPWIRADVLVSTNEEVTRTSTRTHTATQATATESMDTESNRASAPSRRHSYYFPRLTPFILGSAVLVVGWMVLARLRNAESPRRGESLGAGRNASAFLQKIEDEISRGEYQSALEELSSHHREPAPSDYPQYIIPFAGLLIVQNQNRALAERLLIGLLEDGNQSIRSQAHRWLGFLMLSTDEGDMGENHFLEALQTDPKDVASRFNLGRAYLKQERFHQSLDYLQLAELEMPDLWLIHIYKGRARSELGQVSEADSSFRRAVELEPDRWLSYVYYSLFLTSRQERAEAENSLTKMLFRDPQYEQVTPAPWGFFQEKVNYGEYVSVFNHVMSENRAPEKAVGRFLLQRLAQGPRPTDKKTIHALARKGNRLAHLVCLRQDLASNETSDTAFHLSALHGDLRDFGAFAYVSRAQAYAASGDQASAEADLRFALSLEPSTAIGAWTYADFLSKRNRRSEAVGHLERLLAFHPRYIPAILALH